MAVDAAPDGQSLLFELLGDIYMLPVTGGKATVLIAGNSFDSQPRFSPDGKHFVFISDRSGEDNIWLANADGNVTRQVSAETSAEMFSPAWSADGQFIWVSKVSPRRSRSSSVELWKYSIDSAVPPQKVDIPITSQPSLLVSSIPPGVFGPAPTADGRFVYFTSPSPRQHRSLAGPTAQVLRFNIAESKTEAVTFQREGAFKPELSPDGRWLVFGARESGQTGLRIRDLQSGEERWLVFPIDRPALEDRASRDILPNFSFSPDNSSLFAAFGGKLHRINLSDGSNKVVPFIADVQLEVRPRLKFETQLDTGLVKARVIQGTQISPDGSQVAFSAFGRVYVMPVNSAEARLVTKSETAGEFQPAWSPDGQWLAWVSWNGNTGGHLWKWRVGSDSDAEQLTRTAGYYRNPVWTPDGQHVLAVAAPTEVRQINDREQLAAAEQIILLPATGGEAQSIAPAAGTSRMCFGAEPDRFYAYSMAEGLVSRKLDGSDKKSILRVMGIPPVGMPAMAEEVLISPDGKMALALVASRVFQIDMTPTEGGEASTINVFDTSASHRLLTSVGADHIAWQPASNLPLWTVGSQIHIADKPGSRPVNADITLPRHMPEGSLLLRGAKAITMRGDEVIPKADILIQDGRIRAIGARGKVQAPADAQVIHLKGKTVMPGIIDIHSHWDTKRGVLDTQDYSAQASLAFGVTSIRDPQSFDADIFAYSDLVAAGEMIGPRIFSTGMGVFLWNNFSTYEEVRDFVSRYREHYGTHLLKSYLVGSRQVRQWVIRASAELRLMPTTEGGADTKLDLTHALDGFSGIEHTLPTSPLYDDVIQLLARTGITYTPTLLVAFGGPFARNIFLSQEEVFADQKLKRFMPPTILYRQGAEGVSWNPNVDQVFVQMAADANRILQAGGHVGLGGHGEMQGIQVHWEMWALSKGGMKAHDILRVATLESAEAIGLETELGSLEADKAADLLILAESPLEDIRNTQSIDQVMVNGFLYEASTLNQVWPVANPMPLPWWVSKEPSIQKAD